MLLAQSLYASKCMCFGNIEDEKMAIELGMVVGSATATVGQTHHRDLVF
jgi:hypothetical protein